MTLLTWTDLGTNEMIPMFEDPLIYEEFVYGSTKINLNYIPVLLKEFRAKAI